MVARGVQQSMADNGPNNDGDVAQTQEPGHSLCMLRCAYSRIDEDWMPVGAVVLDKETN